MIHRDSTEYINLYSAKDTYNRYFWRYHTGHEVDLIIDRAGMLIPVEIKSAGVAKTTMTDGLTFWHKLPGHSEEASYVLYTGPQDYRSVGPRFVHWANLPALLTQLHAEPEAG
jgi:hypothetical protein